MGAHTQVNTPQEGGAHQASFIQTSLEKGRLCGMTCIVVVNVAMLAVIGVYILQGAKAMLAFG